MSLNKKLNKRMSWDDWYSYAKDYYEEHGNLLIPSKYINASGEKLGKWIYRQRAAYQGKHSYVIDAEQIEKLNNIHMIWKLENRDKWENWYEAARRYKLIYGNIDVPIEYTEDGMCLGNWISEQRKKYRTGKLGEEKIAALKRLGIKWNIMTCLPWGKWYSYAVLYRKEKGNLNVPFDYVTPDGHRLGQWIYTQREKHNTVRRGSLTNEQIKLLNGINMIWNIKEYRKKRWLDMYLFVSEYKEKYNKLPKNKTIKGPDGKSAGYWIITQKSLLSLNNKDKMPEYRKSLLNKIGIFGWKAGGVKLPLAKQFATNIRVKLPQKNFNL
jgi:hypothetical protein